jgi:hypothetical protein
MKGKWVEHEYGRITMSKAVCQELVRVRSKDPAIGKVIWNGPIEKDNVSRPQSALDSKLHVYQTALEGGPTPANLVDRAPFGHLSLNVQSRSLRNRLEPLVGQQLNQGCFATGGRTRYHMPVCLDPEGSRQKLWVKRCASEIVSRPTDHFPTLEFRSNGGLN